MKERDLACILEIVASFNKLKKKKKTKVMIKDTYMETDEDEKITIMTTKFYSN
jgi:uncharacterized protein YrzB (UPF0473 family)